MMLAALSPLVTAGIVLCAVPILAGVAQPYVIWLKMEILRATNHLTRWRDRAQYRYKDAGTFAWMFAWYKMRLDPMFDDLPQLLKLAPTPRVAIDLGCGFGVAANVLLEWFPEMQVTGLDPNPFRVKRANASFASRGTALVAAAPDFEVPGLPDQVDTIFCLDMIHYLSAADLATTLTRLRNRLTPGGFFFLRSPVPPPADATPWRRWRGSNVPHPRSVEQIAEIVTASGFKLIESRPTTGNPALQWFIATA